MSTSAITALERTLTRESAQLGAEIRRTRDFRQMTLHTLAEAAGIGLQTLVRIEDGHPGVSVLILQKVLRVLGLEYRFHPALLVEGSAAYHPYHVSNPALQQALEDASRAACKVLDAFFEVKNPEKNGISSNFQGQLKEHLEAMVCGEPAALTATRLTQLVYSDRSIGGPLQCDDDRCRGWVHRSREEHGKVWTGSALQPLRSEHVAPYASREAAMKAFQKWVSEQGHPPCPVDIVPVFEDDQGELSFSRPHPERQA